MAQGTQPRWWQSGLVLVAMATFAMAFKGIFARLIYQHGIPVDTVLIWRFFLAAPLFWIMARWLTRGQPTLRLSPRQWFLCALTGALFFVSAWCDFHAIATLGASVSRMVLYLFPAILMVIQAAEQRRMPGTAQLAIFAFAWTGITLLLLPGWHGGTLSPTGLLYGFGAAICYAVFWRISQSLTAALGSVRFNQLSNSFTLLFMATVLLPHLPAEQLAVSAPAFGWILVLVVFSTVLPFFLLFEGLTRTDAAEAGVVAMFGPVVTISAAILVFPDERLGPVQWLGAALILASIGALKLVRSRRPEAADVAPSN